MTIHKEVIDALVKWIDHNLERPLKIQEVAIYSGYSKWHLQRIFFQQKGTSLGKYIRERKLYFAAQNLINTDAKICDISMRYGYDFQQIFSRAFLQPYKSSPGVFRNLNKFV
ncbi:helix-turn-helix domain-containing protein [Klebsiella aerogenes]|nr:helix-turn-helix domain-containing protein [Klebsiella aerogenes]